MSTDLITEAEARALREAAPGNRDPWGRQSLFAAAPRLALTVEALWQRLAGAERGWDDASKLADRLLDESLEICAAVGIDTSKDYDLVATVRGVVGDRDWWASRDGRTRAEIEADEKHDEEWERISALSDEEVRAELVAAGIDPTTSRERVFESITKKMAGSHAALRKITQERDEWRAEAKAAQTLLRLSASLAKPLPCGHPLECIPDHEPEQSGEPWVTCGWCAANKERDALRAEVERLRSLLRECQPLADAEAKCAELNGRDADEVTGA